MSERNDKRKARLVEVNKELAKYPHGATSKYTDKKIRRLLAEHSKFVKLTLTDERQKSL